MKYLFDLFLMIAVSVLAGVYNPVLGAFLLFTSFLTATQFWKTVLLLGDHDKKISRSRQVKSMILSVLVVGFFSLSLMEEGGEVATVPLEQAFNDELFPVLVALVLFVALTLATLITEKRKR